MRAANRSAANDMLYARTGATDASAWLYANANRLEDDAIDSLAREIAARRDSELALRNMSDSLGNYWGQFESEDAYKEALARQAEYERLLNLDTQALEAEIAQAERQNQNASAFQNAQAISNWPDWTTNATAWIMNLFRGNAQPYHGAVSPAELYDILAQADSEARKKVPDSELAQMRLDLRNAQSVQTLAQYEKMAQEPGFAERAQEGLAMENPTWQEYLGWLLFGNARLGGQDPANLATFARDNRKWLQASQSDAALNPLGNDAVAASYMYDDEVEIYSGLLAREGKEVADAYLAALRPKLSAREGENIANAASDSMLKQGIYGLSGSFKESMRALGQLAQPDEPMPVSATEYALSAIGENLDETGWRVGDWNLGRTAYDLATNFGGNAAPMAIGNLIAPGAGAVAMGVVSGAGALRDAMRQGYSYGEALPYAAMTGLSEASMSYLLGGIRQLGGKGTRHVAQRLIGKVGNRFARAGLNLSLNALGEFNEEIIQSELDPILRDWLLDENNEIKLLDSDSLYEGFLGALTSMVLGSGEFRQDLRTQDVGAGVMESGKVDDLIDHAQQMGGNVARLAQEMRSGRRPVTEETVGELAKEYAENGGDVSFMQPQLDPNAEARRAEGARTWSAAESAAPEYRASEAQAGTNAVGEMGDDVLIRLHAQADEAAQTPEEADAWRRAVDLAYEAGRRGMPEEELDRFDLSNVESQEEARRAEAPRTAQSAPQRRNTAQAKRRAVRSAYYAGRADAQSEQAAREAVYEEGNTEAAAQPVQADVAQAQATDAAVPTAVQTDVAATQASQADARMQGGTPKGSPFTKGELSAKLTEGLSSHAARKRLPDWTNTRGGLVRQDSAGENLNRQQMAHLRVLEALGRKYNVVFTTQDSISDAQGNRGNARYTGQRTIEVALDAQEGAYTYFATHEMAHYLKSQSADMYAALEDSVRAWADGAGIDFDARVQAAQERYARAGQELTQEQAAEEVVGDMLGTIFADPSAAQELLNNAPRSVLEKIRDFISELLDTISTAARRITGAKDLTALTELEGWAQDMAKMLDVAMAETGRRTAESTHKQDGQSALASERYAIREGVSISREEMQQNMAEVAQMEPVVTLGGHEFDLNAGPLAAQVTEYFNGLGNQVENPVLGTITLNRRGVKDSLSHGIGRLKAMAFYAVPDVLERGRIIDYQKDWKGRGYDTFVLAAPIDVANGRFAGNYYIGAIVLRAYAMQRFYLHELIMQNREAATFKTGAVQENVNPGDATYPTLTSILERVREINRSSESETENSQLSESEGDPRYSLADEGESTPGITLEDVNTLRNIGRKSINAFTSEEIRATEAWARKFYRELGTKSPFFRAWFGDWRANDETQVSVTQITDKAIPRGLVKNTDTGWEIHISNVGIGDTISHAGRARISQKALNNVDELLMRAVLLDSEVSTVTGKKGPFTAFMHKLYAPFYVNGDEYIAKLSVEEYYTRENNTTKRLYNLRGIEIPEASGGLTGEPRDATMHMPQDKISVADLFALVKRFDKDFAPKVASEVVNEDGTPKVMYLGTDSGDGEVGPNGEGGRYYLAPDEAKARQYGETVIEVYANAAEGIQADGTVIVQGAEHIKALENQGTFDAGNPAIRYSLVEERRMEAEGKDVFHERQGSTRPRGVTIEEIGEAIRTRKQMGELVLEAQKLGYRSEAGRLAREIMNGSAEQSAVNIGLLAKAYARESGDEKYVGLAREREEKEGASEGRNLEELGVRLQAAGKTSELIGEAIKQGQRRQSGRMAQGMMNGSVEQSAANLGLLAKVYAQESGDMSYTQEAMAEDRREYEALKRLLGENAPKSLAEFQKLKYNSGVWEEYRNYTRSIEIGELTPLADFKLYQNISEEIDEVLMGVITSDGIRISGKSAHFVARVIGCIEQRRNGVSISNIKQAVMQPDDVKISSSSHQYKLSGMCGVTVNPSTGKLVQCNPLH